MWLRAGRWDWPGRTGSFGAFRAADRGKLFRPARPRVQGRRFDIAGLLAAGQADALVHPPAGLVLRVEKMDLRGCQLPQADGMAVVRVFPQPRLQVRFQGGRRAEPLEVKPVARRPAQYRHEQGEPWRQPMSREKAVEHIA